MPDDDIVNALDMLVHGEYYQFKQRFGHLISLTQNFDEAQWRSLYEFWRKLHGKDKADGA